MYDELDSLTSNPAGVRIPELDYIYPELPPRLKHAGLKHLHVIDRQHRLLPDLPWEAVWNGIASWFGVGPKQIDQILPNKANFDDEKIFTKEQLFDA